MHGLIIGWRVGTDEKDTLDKKEKEKDRSHAESGSSLEPRA
jgi:hypothetical protein